jgi:hypothetical protein
MWHGLFGGWDGFLVGCPGRLLGVVEVGLFCVTGSFGLVY